MKSSITIATLLTILLPSFSFASEVTIPNTFSSGDPALASEVNENFTSVADGINDNYERVVALESAVAALTTRVESLEAASPSVVNFSTHYGTDLIFVTSDGRFIVPYTGEETQQSVPTVDDAVVLDTGYEYNALPGLDSINFEVAQDNTMVLLRSSGVAYNSEFSARSLMDVGLSINGTIPEIGATDTLSIIGDDNLSGDVRSWEIFYTTLLNAGTHTISVMVKGNAQSQANITIDGRSIGGAPGRIKVDIIQIKMPD